MSRILITFEDSRLIIRCKELSDFLRFRGHEVNLFSFDKSRPIADYLFFHKGYVTPALLNTNEYDVWFFDLTTWENKTVEYADDLLNFKGRLACINYEDGYNFQEHRLDKKTLSKVEVFLNNALFVDRDKYSPLIANKTFLVPSFITNSQRVTDTIKFSDKKDEFFFCGSITGLPPDYRCRLNMLLKIKELHLPGYLRVWSSDPSLAHLLSELDEETKGPVISEEEFINRLLTAKFIASPSGNSWPTNRFFEAQAAGGVVITHALPDIEVWGIGIPGLDFIEVDRSAQRLQDIWDILHKNHTYAESISSGARQTWEKYSRLENGIVPLATREYMSKYLEVFLGL